MRTTIDRAGRVVIPKALRDRAGLTPGGEIELRYSDGAIEILPPRPKGRLIRKEGFLVWEPESGSGTVSPEEIQAYIDDLRERRLDELEDRTGL